MSRYILDSSEQHPAIRAKIAGLHRDLVEEVRAAVASQSVVVIGMAQNPNPTRAKRLLQKKNIDYTYLQYGSYFGEWRRRNALKLWTGWPTFPMVFVQGIFIGGADNLKALADQGELDAMLAGSREQAAALIESAQTEPAQTEPAPIEPAPIEPAS